MCSCFLSDDREFTIESYHYQLWSFIISPEYFLIVKIYLYVFLVLTGMVHLHTVVIVRCQSQRLLRRKRFFIFFFQCYDWLLCNWLTQLMQLMYTSFLWGMSYISRRFHNKYHFCLACEGFFEYRLPWNS